MSYRGRPSKGCESCRARKVKCDESKPVCNRCSKSGHECKYRDQADLLFRNQTAFAAQKAEDSWRKRSKSHQRAGSESSGSHHSSPGTHQSPQNLHSSSFNSRTQETFPKVPAPETSTSVIDFNELSIAPGIKPDLRRLAYERFIYDFVVFESPNRAPEEPSDALWDFVPYLYDRAPEGSCLTVAVDAVAYANFASRCNASQAQALAEEYQGKGIKLLQQAITDKEKAHSDDALCSVYLMGVYENLTVPARNGSFLAHSGGANALLQLRSIDEFYANSISARLYEVSFAQMLIGNLQAGKPPPIPIRNIVAARQYLPNFYSNSGIYVIQLIHNEAQLHAKWHVAKHSPVSPTSRLELQELLQEALDLDAEFQAWESTIPRTWRYQMERNTADARSTYDPKWRNLILGSRGAPEEIHTYTSLKRCWVWMFYRTSRIFLLRDLLEILNWMFKLPQPTAAQLAQNDGQMPSDPTIIPNRSPSGVLDNVGLQIHHSFATTHLVNIIEKSSSAVLGTFTVPVYGKSTQDVVGLRGYTLLWSLGIMDSVLKAGLVPDSGAPPSPPSSSGASPIQNPQQAQPSFSPFYNTPAPSPAVFRMPPQNMHPLYHNAPVQVPQMNEFPKLSPIPEPLPQIGASSSPAAQGPTIPPPTDYSTSKLHVFDTSPQHPFDGPTNLPSFDFTITKPARIDVAGRREWLNRMLYYLATELGIRKAIAVPATEGYLELCKTQLPELLAQ